jgi:thiol:disulfide interchange protein
VLRGLKRSGRWLPVLFGAAGIALLPWTIWLSTSLKPHHRTHNWDLAWSGFDSALALAFLLTAFAAWRRSTWVQAAAAATGTLLLADAWFDIVLESRGTELRQAVLEALFAELPGAVLCFWVARRAAEHITYRGDPTEPDRG